MKTYIKKYMAGKGKYVCRIYFIYLPKLIAEPFLGRNLKVTRVKDRDGFLVQPNDD